MLSSFLILVTGSSGLVGRAICEALCDSFEICGIDRVPGKHTSIVLDLSAGEAIRFLKQYSDRKVVLVNCAAAKDDYGLTYDQYFRDNVTAHEMFLGSLCEIQIWKVIHISSVAAFDGAQLKFHSQHGCDDSYRATKFLQDQLYTSWTCDRNIDFTVLYPSAIYSELDSGNNIDSLFKVAASMPVVPSIKSRKSSTCLKSLVSFICGAVQAEVPSGFYLCIENPVLDVASYMKAYKPNLIVIPVPGIKYFLLFLSYFLAVFLGQKYNIRLSPSRVKKLFSDTSYECSPDHVDRVTYNTRSVESQTSVIKAIAIKQMSQRENSG